MRFHAILLAPLSAQAIRIVLSNDDGWAAKTIRVFYDTLTAAGQNVVLSGPAENQSGRSKTTPSSCHLSMKYTNDYAGSLDFPPTQVDGDGCQYQSCPPNSPPTGADTSNPRFNYVNSFPVTAMKYGITNLQGVIGGAPELALSGINAGTNGGIVALISGTVGAATEAAKQGIPAIAFSGTSGEQVGFNTPTLPYQQIYSDLSLNITETLIASGKPYLPKDIWINVNFPAVGASGEACSKTSDFKFVLSRIYPWLGGDVETCGGTRLPDETTVFNADGCHVSVSVSNAYTKADVNAATQKVVLDKLSSILSCLP